MSQWYPIMRIVFYMMLIKHTLINVEQTDRWVYKGESRSYILLFLPNLPFFPNNYLLYISTYSVL